MNLTKDKVLCRAKQIIMIFNTGSCILDKSIPMKVKDCSLEQQYIDIRMEAKEDTLNLFRIMHGGVIAWVADVAMATAVSVFNGEVHSSTIDMNINYIRPVPAGTEVICRAWNQNCGGFIKRARADFFVNGELSVSCTGNYTGKNITGQRMIRHEDDGSWTILNGNISCSIKGERQFNRMINFMKCFGQLPSLFLDVPGRTELGGNHTDHQCGKVLAASIGKFISAAVSSRYDGKASIVSEGFGEIDINLNELEAKEDEHFTAAALVRGIAAAFAKSEGEDRLPGFNAYISSEIPLGKGLSSSAAFEILIARIFNELGQFKKNTTELAIMSQFAENNYYGKPCGLMDQIICAEGGTLKIDFAGEYPDIAKLNFRPENHGYKLLLIDTNAGHEDLSSDYAAIPAELKSVSEFFGKEYLRDVPEDEFNLKIDDVRKLCGQRAVNRALHVYAENKRVDAMAEAINDGRFEDYLKLVRESGLSSATLLENVIPSDKSRTGMADALTLIEKQLDGKGASRVHGGGFAGCVQAYVPLENLKAFTEKIEANLGKGSCLELNF